METDGLKQYEFERWTRGQRRRDWNNQITRMENNRITKITRVKKANTKRLPKDQQKKWTDKIGHSSFKNKQIKEVEKSIRGSESKKKEA